MKKFLLTGVASLALISSANADVQIRMKPKDQCWSYRGHDNRFYGDFAGGQSLSIGFVVQQANDHGGITTHAYNGDAVWVNGPAGYGQTGKEAVWANDPELDHPMSNPNASISTEKPGHHIFNLMEHGAGSNLPVFFEICAMSKDLARRGRS
jgi:hypothetical protein